MITLTVSFKPDEANLGMIAQVAQLLAKLETQSPTLDPVVTAQPTNKEEPAKAPRAKRVYTEAEKQAIRERLAAGRAKAALARGETPAPKVVVVKPDANHKSGSKPKVHHGVIEMVVTKQTKVEKAIDDAKKDMAASVKRIQGTVHPAPKPSAKKPVPAKGHKVEPKPAAE